MASAARTPARTQAAADTTMAVRKPAEQFRCMEVAHAGDAHDQREDGHSDEAAGAGDVVVDRRGEPACSPGTAPIAVAVRGATASPAPHRGLSPPAGHMDDIALPAAAIRSSRARPAADDQRADRHLQPWPDPRGEATGASRERQHDDRDRKESQPRRRGASSARRARGPPAEGRGAPPSAP